MKESSNPSAAWESPGNAKRLAGSLLAMVMASRVPEDRELEAEIGRFLARHWDGDGGRP